MKKALLLIKDGEGANRDGEEGHSRTPQIPDDDVHFQRFRYPTKEEQPGGGTKGREENVGRNLQHSGSNSGKVSKVIAIWLLVTSYPFRLLCGDTIARILTLAFIANEQTLVNQFFNIPLRSGDRALRDDSPLASRKVALEAI
jgi:hypothetical protein